MNETRRFLRYITPGVLFGFLILLFLWIAVPGWTISILKSYIAAKEKSITIIIGSLFISGALGYLFATMHHWCHWYLPIDKNVINHTEQIKKLREKGFIPPITCVQPNPRLEALTIVSILWFERLGDSSPVGNSENRVAAFSDLAHSAGTARVASACALMAAILLCMLYGNWNPSVPNVIRFILMVVIGIMIICLFHDAYQRTGKISQQLYDQILEHNLEKEQANGQHENAT
ncbi:MAG: hypothetical protein ABIJ52_13260 [Pseudomonadota bacterium]